MEGKINIIRKNLSIVVILVGLILFTISIGWNLQIQIGYQFDLEAEVSNQLSVLLHSLYIIGIIFVTFGITNLLYEYTSKLNLLKNKTLYQLTITLSFLFAIILNIISRIIYYNAIENFRSGDFVTQMSTSQILSITSDFGLLIMFILIFIFLFKLYHLDKFMMIAPTTMPSLARSEQVGLK